MRRTDEKVRKSIAWVRALRAAALLLNREVCRYILACRADLAEDHKQHLEDLSQRAWEEAFALYNSGVWLHFEIDEPELHRRALALSRLRMSGRLEEAAETEREALRRVLSAA